MGKNEDILEIIYFAIDEVNQQLPKNRKIEKKPEETLFGKQGKLDSLGLVNLIVSIEGLIDEKLDKYITLADEKAMSMKNSPFRTIGTLRDYISELLEND